MGAVVTLARDIAFVQQSANILQCHLAEAQEFFSRYKRVRLLANRIDSCFFWPPLIIADSGRYAVRFGT
jgi:hypothetical protein